MEKKIIQGIETVQGAETTQDTKKIQDTEKIQDAEIVEGEEMIQDVEPSLGGREQQAAYPPVMANFFAESRQFEELMMMYECAIREVQTKLEILDREFSVRYKRNPISSIESRVKSPMSIYRKLQKHNLPVNVKNIVRNLNDVAGIRVICNFIDDIYDLVKMVARQDDLRVVSIKDYIRHPKENGYRSYHMIVEVPVFFSRAKQIMRVEIQIRTIAMNFWASLEHQIRYKKDIENMDGIDQISQELFEAAEIIAQTDQKMQAIKNKIDEVTEISV